MKRYIVLFLFLFTPISCWASSCDNLFPNGKEIVITNTKVLCNSFYVTVYDNKNKATVFSSEISPVSKNKVDRTNDFHSDSRIVNSPTPEDYIGVGYDRGHMTPAEDATTVTQMHDTFLMTNMTPQEPTINRGVWKMLEEKVKKYPYKYIVTGATYSYPSATIGKHKIPVPKLLWKVVFLSDGTTQAFYVNNTKSSLVASIPIVDLEQKIGYKLH
jgi:endonuclease G